MTGRTKLKMADSDEQLREVADYLWEMALSIEDGDLSAAERRLRQAQEALKQALENGASDEEIDRLMAELREAMNEFLREFAERAEQNPNLCASSCRRTARNCARATCSACSTRSRTSPSRATATRREELLSQLQDMMNNLQAGRQQRGQNGQQNSEMRRADGQARRDHAAPAGDDERDLPHGPDAARPGSERAGRAGRAGQGNRAVKPMTPEEFAEAMKQLQQGQGQLQGDLEALMKGLEGMGIQPGEGFGEAGEAMGEAEGSLGRGEGDRAVGEQGRALEALRRGAQDMMQQMCRPCRATRAAARKADASRTPTATRSAGRAPRPARISAIR